MNADGRSGFTLMEVFVALALLSSGVLVLAHFVDSFNRVASLEREQAKALVQAASAIELLVQSPPSCADASLEIGGVQVVVRSVPGVSPLAWVWSTSSAVHEVRLRRLVRCKKVR